MSQSYPILLILLAILLNNTITKSITLQIQSEHDALIVPQSPAQSKGEAAIQEEVSQAASIHLDYEHIRTYSFQLLNKSDFVIKVDYDQEIKAVFSVYWGDTQNYGHTGYQQGEQVSLSIYHGQSLIFSYQCFQKCYFIFFAKKGESYSLSFQTKGKRKIISLDMQCFISEREGQQKLHTYHMNMQQIKIDKVRIALKSLLKVARNNYVIGTQISMNVAKHSRGYIRYQLIEMLLIIIGASIQTFCIKNLIGPRLV